MEGERRRGGRDDGSGLARGTRGVDGFCERCERVREKDRISTGKAETLDAPLSDGSRSVDGEWRRGGGGWLMRGETLSDCEGEGEWPVTVSASGDSSLVRMGDKCVRHDQPTNCRLRQDDTGVKMRMGGRCTCRRYRYSVSDSLPAYSLQPTTVESSQATTRGTR